MSLATSEALGAGGLSVSATVTDFLGPAAIVFALAAGAEGRPPEIEVLIGRGPPDPAAAHRRGTGGGADGLAAGVADT